MEAKLCGAKALKVVIALSVILAIPTIGCGVLGMYFGFDARMWQSSLSSGITAVSILVTVFFLRKSYVFGACSLIGACGCACHLITAGILLVLALMAHMVKISLKNLPSTTPDSISDGSSTEEYKEKHPVLVIMYIHFAANLLVSILIAICSFSFWKLSGISLGDSENRYNVEEPTQTGKSGSMSSESAANA